MDLLFLQTVVLIGELPGSLVYHLVTLFALQAAAAMAFNSWRRERSATASRLTLAASSAFLLSLLALAGTLLGALQLLTPALTLSLVPPLARLVSTVTALAMLWAFAFPTPSRFADVLAFGLALLALLGAGVSWMLWFQAVAAGAVAYNATPPETVWELAQIVLLGLGLLLLIVRAFLRRLPDAWIGVLAALLLLLGHGAHLLWTVANTSLPGAVRLAELLALPLFTAMIYRRLVGGRPPAPTPAALSPSPSTATAPLTPATETARRSLDPKAAVALASLNTSADPDELAQIITLAVAHTCRAELCLLISPPDDLGMSSLTCAYDLVREQFLPGNFLSAGDSQTLRDAFAASGITRLTPAEHAPDLRRLSGAVGIGPIGPAMVAPLLAKGQRLGSLVLIALYSHREWTPEDENVLAALREPIGEALSGDNQVNRLTRDLAQLEGQLETAEAARRFARQEADQLSVALEGARAEAERFSQDLLALRQTLDANPPADGVDQLRTAILAGQTAGLVEIEADWRSRLDAAELEVAAQRHHAAQLEADCQTLRDRLQDADDRRSELEAELEPLRANLAAFAAQTAELERVRAQAGTAGLAPADRDQELTRLQVDLRSTQALLAAQTAAAQANAAQIEQWRAELAEAAQVRAQLAEMEAELSAAAEWRVQAETAQKELAALADWRTQAEAARRDLAAQGERIAQLQAELERRQAAPPAQAEPLPDAERARLEAQVREMREYAEAQQWQMATWKLDYDFAVQQEQQLRTELDLTRAELRRLTEAGAGLPPAPSAGLAEAQTALAAAESSFKETQAALNATRSELSATQAALTDTRSELTVKERQLAKAQTIVASLNDQVRQSGEIQSELAGLKSQLDRAQTAAAEARRQLQAREAQLDEARREHAGQLDEAQRQLATQEEALTSSHEALEAKEQELANAMAALAELANQTHQLTLTQKQLAEKERLLAEMEAARAPEASAGTTARPFLPEASMEVIASLSQELRQPMAAIVGYSDLLLGESVGILGALQRKFLERVKASCERMEGLLNDLIRVTDIDAGTLQLVPESLDVLYIVEDAILSCSAQFREKGINLRLDIADELPTVSADRDALRQIISHLLSNAGNASGADGEVTLKVRSETDPANVDLASHALVIAVRDSGGGIAPEDQPRVFQRFYRADAPLITGLGETGVGLSVAKALVEAHGGRIWLNSEPGQGSLFTVLLPIHGKNGVAVPAPNPR